MVKRIFDGVVSLAGLVILFPLFVAVAVLIKVDSRGPIFYRGARVGQFGKLFRIFKFRTMILGAEQVGISSSAEDDPRITRVGKLLRRYKLDELPQLFNVLAGDMSLVGPRPQVQWAVELYNQQEKQLLTVRPGITDYASIMFRSEGEILRGSADPDRDYLEKIAPEKIRLGLEYVGNHSFWIDLKIIVATLWTILGGDPETILEAREGRLAAADRAKTDEVV